MRRVGMGKRFAGFVDLREGEERPAYYAGLALFLMVAAHTLLETARDALFLVKLPPSRLTFVYAAVAVLALVVAQWNVRFTEKFGRRPAMVFSLLVAAYGTTVIYLVPHTAEVIFVLYVWSALLGTILVVQFWMFCGSIFTVAQGKRLFGPVAAGGVLGAVVGAAFAVGLLEVAAVKELLIAAVGLLLLTSLLLTGFPVDSTVLRSESTPLRARQKRGGLRALISEHPYVARIAALLVISSAALLVIDYLFKSTAAAVIPADALGSFFARYYTALNALALVVQLFVAGALVRRVGVVLAALVLPVLLVFGAVGSLVFAGAMAVVLLTKGAEGSMRHSLHKISLELLWMPLPDRVRSQAKSVLDSVVARGIQAVTAALLLILATLKLDTPVVLSGMLGVLAVAWVSIVISMRGPYLDLFRQALRLRVEGDLELDLNSVEVAVEALSSPDPTRVLASMDLLASNQRSGLIPGLILYHDSPEVLVRALELIGKPTRRDWPPLTNRLLEHADAEVRVAALKALAAIGDVSAIERRTLDINPEVRSHAAFWLCQVDPHDDPLTHPSISQILSMEGEKGRAAQAGLLDAIASSGDARWVETILRLAASSKPELGEKVARAMARVPDPRFLPFLIERLAYREGREITRRAIMALGQPALDALDASLRAPATSPRVRTHIPRTISKFGTQEAADVLVDNLMSSSEGIIRFKVLRGLSRLAVEHAVRIDRALIDRQIRDALLEYFRMLALVLPVREHLSKLPSEAQRSGRLLCGLLEDKQHQAEQRAMLLLQTAHRNEDIRAVVAAIRSHNRTTRANALEYLDALTLDSSVPEVRDLLRLIADDLSPQQRLERASLEALERPASHEDAVAFLIGGDDDALAAIAAYHALGIDSARLHETVRAAAEQRPELTVLVGQRPAVEAMDHA